MYRNCFSNCFDIWTFHCPRQRWPNCSNIDLQKKGAEWASLPHKFKKTQKLGHPTPGTEHCRWKINRQPLTASSGLWQNETQWWPLLAQKFRIYVPLVFLEAVVNLRPGPWPLDTLHQWWMSPLAAFSDALWRQFVATKAVVTLGIHGGEGEDGVCVCKGEVGLPDD